MLIINKRFHFNFRQVNITFFLFTPNLIFLTTKIFKMHICKHNDTKCQSWKSKCKCCKIQRNMISLQCNIKSIYLFKIDHHINNFVNVDIIWTRWHILDNTMIIHIINIFVVENFVYGNNIWYISDKYNIYNHSNVIILLMIFIQQKQTTPKQTQAHKRNVFVITNLTNPNCTHCKNVNNYTYFL